jgi:phosphoribosylaminoimidazole carboxylase (NCAIR synthetase)
MDTRYLRLLKAALTGAPACTLAVVCNFEAERLWAEGYAGLPAPAFAASTLLVRRMEELGSLLAGPNDLLVLKHPLDPGYRAYLEDLGLRLPTVLVPENTTPDRPTAQDVLDSPVALRRLNELAADGAYLLPMGTSIWEQRLAEACRLPLAVPDAATFQRVNSKIYGRRLAARAGLRCVPGDCCETVEEFVATLGRYRRRLGDGGFRIVVKDAYGVSGKGLVVIDDVAKADRLTRMVLRGAERRADPRLYVVVEEWLPKRCDLNYQVTVSRDGQITLDFVKQALTDNGVHLGHLMPPELDPAGCRHIEQAAQTVGRCLYADGYHGVAGIDAIVDIHGYVYPVLEINARLNMSTYQGGVTEQLQGPAQVAMARHYPLRLDEPCGFDDLRRSLWPAMDLRKNECFVVTCFGTVNANADRPAPFDGRLYAMLVASDRQRLAAIDRAAADALRHLPAH